MRLMEDNALSAKVRLGMVVLPFCISFVFCGIILSDSQAEAQQANWQGGARGTAARAIGQRPEFVLRDLGLTETKCPRLCM